MGLRSTHYISRELALEVIKAKINQQSNQFLANVLYDFDESEYRNYCVGSKGYPSVDTMEQFNDVDYDGRENA